MGKRTARSRTVLTQYSQASVAMLKAEEASIRTIGKHFSTLKIRELSGSLAIRAGDAAFVVFEHLTSLHRYRDEMLKGTDQDVRLRARAGAALNKKYGREIMSALYERVALNRQVDDYFAFLRMAVRGNIWRDKKKKPERAAIDYMGVLEDLARERKRLCAVAAAEPVAAYLVVARDPEVPERLVVRSLETLIERHFQSYALIPSEMRTTLKLAVEAELGQLEVKGKRSFVQRALQFMRCVATRIGVQDFPALTSLKPRRATKRA